MPLPTEAEIVAEYDRKIKLAKIKSQKRREAMELSPKDRLSVKNQDSQFVGVKSNLVRSEGMWK